MSHPVPIFGTQDVNDDDAAVIDSYTIETNAPPPMEDATQPIPPTPATPITVAYRLTPSGEQVLQATFDPVQLFWPDDKRKHLNIRVYSPTATANDGIRIGNTPAEARKGARVLHGATPTIDDMTGSLWVFPESLTGAANSGPVNVEYWAVTV